MGILGARCAAVALQNPLFPAPEGLQRVFMIGSRKKLTRIKEQTMEYSIRKAQAGDAQALAELVRDIGWFAHVNAELPEDTRERVKRHLGLNLADDSHTVYLAVDGTGWLLGFAAVHWLPYMILSGPEGYVSELFVRAAARGKGVGGRLLDAVKEDARRRGCSRLSLLNNETRESYVRGFYQKHGWEERGVMKNMVYRFPKE
jgi:GNAT superfamily N-acetyltransferase